jgi:bacterioferritin (cytochrome b1)
MTEDRFVVAVLNELLLAEFGGLGQRLGESQPYADSASCELLAAVQRGAAQTQEHIAWLSEMIVLLGGVPATRVSDVYSTDMHYVSVEVLLPRLLKDTERLVETYRLAADRLAGRRAAELVNRIRTRHEQQLQALKELRSTGRT